MTAPPTLYLITLGCNFDVERVDVILGHNVEYPGSMSKGNQSMSWGNPDPLVGLGGPDSPMKISANFINVYPLKKPNFSPVWHGPPLVVFLLSTLTPKWAALTLTLCAQHCVPASHLHVPHQKFTSTRFRTV